jgi:hypothetical protein
MAMEELKSCLFCGRYIDKTFAYCPYCGFEFGQRDDAAEYTEETPAASLVSEEIEAAPAAGKRPDYIARLRDMQKLLTDMESELDLLLSKSGAALRPAKIPDKGRGSVGLSGRGQVTSSSEGP